MPAMRNIVQTEHLLTPVLLDMEMEGLQLDRAECKRALAEGYRDLLLCNCSVLILVC